MKGWTLLVVLSLGFECELKGAIVGCAEQGGLPRESCRPVYGLAAREGWVLVADGDVLVDYQGQRLWVRLADLRGRD